MIAGGVNQRCRQILAPVGVDLAPGDAREQAFSQPLPHRWRPAIGERVYLRAGLTIGARAHRIVTVWRPCRGKRVDVRVPVAGSASWKSQEVSLDDVRPV
jgi:hypothetical protein